MSTVLHSRGKNYAYILVELLSGFFLAFSCSIHLFRFWQRTPQVKLILLVLLTVFWGGLLHYAYTYVNELPKQKIYQLLRDSFLLCLGLYLISWAINPLVPMPEKSLIIEALPGNSEHNIIVSKISISEKDVPLYNLNRIGKWISTSILGQKKQLITEEPGKLTYRFITEPQQYYAIRFLANPLGGNAHVIIGNHTHELDLSAPELIERKISGTLYHGEVWIGICIIDLLSCWILMFSLGLVYQKYLQNFTIGNLLQKLSWGASTYIIILALLLFPVAFQLISIRTGFVISIFVLAIIAVIKPMVSVREIYSHKKILTILLAISILALIALPIMGWSIRYIHDDYLSAVDLRNGPIPLITRMYYRLLGRFSYFLLMGVAYEFTPNFAKVLPILSLSLFICLTAIVFYKMIKRYDKTFFISESVLLSTIACGLFLYLIPNLVQSYFWMVGNLLYFFPYIFVMGNLLLFNKWKNRANVFTLIGLFSYSFLLGGFTEPLSIALIVAGIGGFIAFSSFFKSDQIIRNSYLSMVIGWMIGGGLSILSPGIFNRLRHNVGIQLSIDSITARTISVPIKFISDILTTSPLAVIIAISIFFLIGIRFRNKLKSMTILKLIVISIVTYWSTFTISSLIGELPSRAYTTATIFFLILIGLLGIALSKLTSLPSRYFKRLIIPTYFFAICLMGAKFWNIYSMYDAALVRFATNWDKIHFELLEQQQQSVINAKTSIDPIFSLDMGTYGSMSSSEKDLTTYYGFSDIQFPYEE